MVLNLCLNLLIPTFDRLKNALRDLDDAGGPEKQPMLWVVQCVFFYPTHIWVFPKIGVGPQNGWFIMENPIKMDDLGGKPTIFGNIHMSALDFQRCFPNGE